MTDSTCKLCRSYPDRRGGGCRLSKSWAGHLASYGQAASEHCLASTGNDRCPASRHHAIRGHRRRDPLRSLRQPPIKAARRPPPFQLWPATGRGPMTPPSVVAGVCLVGRCAATLLSLSAVRVLASWSSPVLLVAAIPLAVADVSRLAKRPRSGLALTRRTRPRSSSSEEGGSSVGR